MSGKAEDMEAATLRSEIRKKIPNDTPRRLDIIKKLAQILDGEKVVLEDFFNRISSSLNPETVFQEILDYAPAPAAANQGKFLNPFIPSRHEFFLFLRFSFF
eukprot:TRINITY_DN2208_c0_g1_i10.p1 TRINITY_DN2208_c0_g1~~TRINITY_DN2208_c0_g1_i10.p1  ORF type:complete len:102 (-),score=12.77 TRINITY_DN2208_c0_g1_i10:78-383(-)